MSNRCPVCGKTKSEAMADAKAIGLQEAFERGVYTCCQVAEWADEQALAWVQATHEDSWCEPGESDSAELSEGPPVFVYVRRRRPQVPWYRNPDDRF
jgi:hypothetical protein